MLLRIITLVASFFFLTPLKAKDDQCVWVKPCARRVSTTSTLNIEDFFNEVRGLLGMGPLTCGCGATDQNFSSETDSLEDHQNTRTRNNTLKVVVPKGKSSKAEFLVDDFECQLFQNGVFAPKINNKINVPNGENGERLVGIFKEQGICLKQWPEMPKLELAFNAFANILFPGSDLTPKAAIILINDQVFLATTFIEGKVLSHYFRSEAETLPHLQEIPIFQLILTSIMTMPEDGRPQNYILSRENKIIAIDNDRNLADGVVRKFYKDKDGNIVLMRCHSALFVLDEMKKSIPQQLIEHLKTIDIDDLLKCLRKVLSDYSSRLPWLNDHYLANPLMQYNGCSLKNVSENVIERIELRMQAVQDLIRRKDNYITPVDLLNAVSFSIGALYERTYHDCDIWKRYNAADGELMETVLPIDYIVHLNGKTAGLKNKRPRLAKYIPVTILTRSISESISKQQRQQQKEGLIRTASVPLEVSIPNEIKREPSEKFFTEKNSFSLIGGSLYQGNILQFSPAEDPEDIESLEFYPHLRSRVDLSDLLYCKFSIESAFRAVPIKCS